MFIVGASSHSPRAIKIALVLNLGRFEDFDISRGCRASVTSKVATKASLPQRVTNALWERSPDRDFEAENVKLQ